MMWWNHGDWGVGSWVSMSVMMLVVWGLIIGLIVWAVRSVSEKPSGTGTDRRPAVIPDDVLSGRLARGEITEEEFVRRRSLLHSSAASAGPPADRKGSDDERGD